MKALLVLENGRAFWGESIGVQGEVKGEVVFNTGMTGYQEVLTDPSYAGQIVTMTYPLMGNYGVNLEDHQSQGLQVKGFIVKEECRTPGNWRSQGNLNDVLAASGVVGIKGIDTRALTRIIRSYGTLKGMITSQRTDIDVLVEELKLWEPERDVVGKVSTSKPYSIPGEGPRVVVLDYGVKRNILNNLHAKGFDLTVLPGSMPAEEILALNPQGLFLSNGPGDPKEVSKAVKTIKQLSEKLPIFAICLGHQLLTLAMGGDTYKLKFGHRGSNQPVQDLQTKRVYITSQNHGYAVDMQSLKNTDLEVTHRNLNDGTVEGLKHTKLPIFSVQYHPEAGPGPSDSTYLFDNFAELMRGDGNGH